MQLHGLNVSRAGKLEDWHARYLAAVVGVDDAPFPGPRPSTAPPIQRLSGQTQRIASSEVFDALGEDTHSIRAMKDALALPFVEDEDVPELDSIPRGVAILLVLKGRSAGSRFLVSKDPTSIGRDVSSDVYLSDAGISRKHAELVRFGDLYSIRDTGSTNGTYVNRRRIIAQQLLRLGDQVQIGGARLMVLTRPDLTSQMPSRGDEGRHRAE